MCALSSGDILNDLDGPITRFSGSRNFEVEYAYFDFYLLLICIMLWLFAPTEVTDAISVSMTSSDIERWDARDPVLGRICVGCLYRLTSRYHIRPCSYHMSPNGELLGGESPNPTRLEAKRSIFLYRIPFHLERDHIRHIDLATDRHFTVDYGVARLKMTNGDKNCGTQTYADTL